MQIYCSSCGKLLEYGKHWRSSLAGGIPVCDKECLDNIDNAYCKMIVERNHG